MQVDVDLPAINLLSLCTGGAGLDVGVELALPRARSVCLVEREAYAIRRLVSAMEDGRLDPAPIWTDVATFRGRPWRGLVDGLIGGIPCQPHSLAGKRGGSTDERDLWSEARRIIAQSRPWFVLIENVAGMLSAGADEVAGAERVRRDLLAMGYEVEGGLFTASEVGFTHKRERIFILAVANGYRLGQQRDGQARSSQRIGSSSGHGGTALADSEHGRRDPGQRHGSSGHGKPELQSADSDQAVVDSQGVGRGLHEGQRRSDERASDAGGGGEAVVDAVDRFGRRRADQSQREQEGGASAGRPSDQCFHISPPRPGDLDWWRDILAERPDLAPATAEHDVRLLADGLGSSRIDELRLYGNGVVPLVAAYALRTLATRLSRRSAGAAGLVRMMEAA